MSLVLVVVGSELVVMRGLVLPLVVGLDIEDLHEGTNLNIGELIAHLLISLITNKVTITSRNMRNGLITRPRRLIINLLVVLAVVAIVTIVWLSVLVLFFLLGLLIVVLFLFFSVGGLILLGLVRVALSHDVLHSAGGVSEWALLNDLDTGKRVDLGVRFFLQVVEP